jgi:hypothetical protein
LAVDVLGRGLHHPAAVARWFPSFGCRRRFRGGIGIGWMASVAADLTNFVTNS